MISVILPTYNRASALKTSLERLSVQKGVEFEVIVVDDGSTDETEKVVCSFDSHTTPSSKQIPPLHPNPAFTTPLGSGRDEKRYWERFHYIHQQNSGQAVARNRGVQEAKGELILFFQDDTFAIDDHFLKRHVEAHQKHSEENVAVLGYITWDPALEINDYMLFLEASGWQFGYGFLKPGFVDSPEPYKFFYTSNLSLKKSFFEKEKFNESFRAYGWEDTELGYRLWKKHDMKLFYEPEAAAHHHHPMAEADLPKRMQKIGASAVQFQALHPELSVIPKGWKRGVIKVVTLKPCLILAKMISKTLYFKLLSWREFFVGAEQRKIF